MKSPIKKLIDNLLSKDSEKIEWYIFANGIKTYRRFFFKNEANILKKIKDIITELELINTIPKGTIIYRARSFKEGNKIVNDLRRMGPPLPEDIQHVSNRMSPPGIPIFYGSFDKITALSEISDIKKNRYAKMIKKNRYVNNRYANIAQFKLLKDIDIIDFTKADSMRVSESIQYQVEKERKILFMRYLGREFSEPIEKDGKEHTEYVPTQIFTEYIKHNIKNIKGIKYNSGKTCGANLALFLDQEHFCDNESKINNHYFFMDSRSTQTIEIPVARSYELSLEGLPYRSSSGKIKIQKTNNSFEFYFAFFDHHSQQTNSIVNCSNKFKVDNQMCSYIKVKWSVLTYEQNILEKFGLNNQDIIQNKMNEEKDITVTKKYNVTLMDELSVAYTQSIFNAIDKIEKLFTAESCYKKLILQGQYHVRSNILEMDGMPSTQLDSKIPGSDADLKELDSSEINEYARLKQEFSKLNLQ